MSLGPYELEVHSENNHDSQVTFEVKVNNSSSLKLSSVENNSNDEFWNNVVIINNRTDLNENELDAKKIFRIKFY